MARLKPLAVLQINVKQVETNNPFNRSWFTFVLFPSCVAPLASPPALVTRLLGEADSEQTTQLGCNQAAGHLFYKAWGSPASMTLVSCSTAACTVDVGRQGLKQVCMDRPGTTNIAEHAGSTPFDSIHRSQLSQASPVKLSPQQKNWPNSLLTAELMGPSPTTPGKPNHSEQLPKLLTITRCNVSISAGLLRPHLTGGDESSSMTNHDESLCSYSCADHGTPVVSGIWTCSSWDQLGPGAAQVEPSNLRNNSDHKTVGRWGNSRSELAIMAVGQHDASPAKKHEVC